MTTMHSQQQQHTIIIILVMQVSNTAISSCHYLLCWLHSSCEYLETQWARRAYFNSKINSSAVHQELHAWPFIYHLFKNEIFNRRRNMSRKIFKDMIMSFWCLTSQLNEFTTTTMTLRYVSSTTDYFIIINQILVFFFILLPSHLAFTHLTLYR